MRKFKCDDCHHEFEVSHGQGGRGADMKCPQCQSSKVFRLKSGTRWAEDNWVRRGRTAMGHTWNRWMAGSGRGAGRGVRGRGRRRRNLDAQHAEQGQTDVQQK